MGSHRAETPTLANHEIGDGHKLEYQCVPRICALAEVAWRPAELRNADEFLQRVLAHYPWFDEQNINYRREDGRPAGKVGF